MEGIQEKYELSVDSHHPLEDNQDEEQKLGLGFQSPNLDDQTLDHQSVCDQEDGLIEKLGEMGIEDEKGLIGEKNDGVGEKIDLEGEKNDGGAEDEVDDTKGEAKSEESEVKGGNGGEFKGVKEGVCEKEGSKWSEIEEEEEGNENCGFEEKKDEWFTGEKEEMNGYGDGWDENWNEGAGRNEANEGRQYYDNYENGGYRKEQYNGYGNVEGDSEGMNDGNNGSFHYPLRPDAEDCSLYMRTGTCKYGPNRKFNHPLRRKNQAARDMFKQREDNFDRPGPTECKYHSTPGGCKYGKACRYNHGRPNPKPAPAPITEFNFLGLPMRVGERECPYYMRTSSCKYGPNCRFNHPDPTVVGGGDSASQGSIKDTIPDWSSARTLNENAPYMPVMDPPSPTAPPNGKWNEYQGSMGGKSSKRSAPSRYSSFGSSSNSNLWNHNEYPQSAYPLPPQTYAAAPPPQSYGGWAPEQKKRTEQNFSKICDNYSSLDQVTEALARAGLESSNLIVGIDFTKSNEWTGARSFHRKSLHHIGDDQNPYEAAISIIGRTLASFDEDNLIPCFGFGDASTHDQEVFSFYLDDRSCDGFEEVLTRYRELVPQLRLAGPTSFAPIIEMAITIVEQSRGQYHVLLIIADGQGTRSVDTERGQLSPQERKTVEAIVKASEYPLSIILVGVGDGPWDMMREFDDNIPARTFDNFQFVNFTEIMSKNLNRSRKEAEFALAALMEIPSQYKATLELNILNAQRGKAIDRIPLPPPHYGMAS